MAGPGRYLNVIAKRYFVTLVRFERARCNNLDRMPARRVHLVAGLEVSVFFPPLRRENWGVAIKVFAMFACPEIQNAVRLRLNLPAAIKVPIAIRISSPTAIPEQEEEISSAENP